MENDLDVDVSGYSTAMELEFLSGLGTFGLRPCSDRAALLRGYLVGAMVRVRWGKIDRRQIISFAKERLAELEAGIPLEPGKTTAAAIVTTDQAEVSYER